MADASRRFDPLGLLTTLDRHRVDYIVVGAFGRVVHGADEITRGVDIVPSTKPDNLQRLEEAVEELEAQRANRRAPSFADIELASENVIELSTNRGELKIVPQPEGTGGYDDLRRASTREPLGKGVRSAIASVDDLARMLAALGRDQDQAKLRDLRRLAELELNRGIEL